MLRQLKFVGTALLVLFALTACNDTDNYHGTFNTTKGALVINQGNQYNGIAGTLGTFDTNTLSYSANAFENVNGQSLGDTPQNVIVHGGKVYVPVFGSDRVWVLDKNTLRIVHTINTNQPEWVDAYKNYLYIANNDGFVTRVDTLTWEQTTLAVGPNPAGLVVSRGALWVTISDGYNYANQYADGKKVVKVNLEGFTVEKEIACGMNPGKITADSYGNIYFVARGNYGYDTSVPFVPSLIQYIRADETLGPNAANVEQGFTLGTDLQACGEYLYVINAAYSSSSGSTDIDYKVYNSVTKSIYTDSKFTAGEQPAWPTGVYVDPVTQLVYITSDPSPTGYNDQGWVYIYRYDGAFITRFQAGIHPFAVAFIHEQVTV